MTDAQPTSLLENSRGGYRGYIASRPVNGTRLPQHLQNLIVREHARRHGLQFLLSATEYTMPHCYMMLEQVLEELPRLDGIICYSLFMLPKNARRRRHIFALILESGRELHAAAEDLVLRTKADAAALDDLLTIEDLTSTQGIPLGLGLAPDSLDPAWDDGF